MAISLAEAELLIRLEFKTWGLADHTHAWADMKPLGLACPHNKEIVLSNSLRESSALLVEIVKHEIAHLLDHKERGTFQVNGKNVFHGRNWKKWCRIVGCRPRRFIPV
jgi:hypothetical protein